MKTICFVSLLSSLYLPDISNHTINIGENVRNNLSEVIFDDSKIILRTKIFKKYSLYVFLSQYDGLCFILLRRTIYTSSDCPIEER